MSIVKTAGQGVAWNSAALIAGKAVILANIFIILRSLSVYEYGFNELVMSIISTVSIVMLPGLVSTVIADLGVERGRENLSRMKQIFQQFFFLNLTMGAIAWLVLFFGSHLVALWAGNELAAGFLRIASFLFLVTPLRTNAIVLATVMLRYFDQSFYGVFEEVVKFLLIVIFIVWLKLGVQGLIFSIVLSQLIVVLGYLPRTISAYRHFSSGETEGSYYFWNLVREHRKWSVLSSYIGTFSQNLRLWIIKLLLGTEAVGLFAFAYGIMGNVTSLIPIGSVITPIVPRYIDKPEQLIRIVRASLKLQVIVTLVLILAAYICSDIFIRMLFPQYVPAIGLVYIILLAIVPLGIVGIFTPVFAAFKEQRSMLFSTVFKLGLLCFFLAPLIYCFGIAGTAIEIVLTSGFSAIERYVRVKRIVRGFSMPMHDVFAPDAYEREAMHTVRSALRIRLPKIWPFSSP